MQGICNEREVRKVEFVSKSFSELTCSQLYEILKSRLEVFLLEQGIVCQDLDDKDYVSRHFFLWDGKRVTAYARGYYDETLSAVKLGRILTLSHGSGHGRILMENVLSETAKAFSCSKIYISAQKHAVGFYEKFGFSIVSGEYLEEGIIHIAMERTI